MIVCQRCGRENDGRYRFCLGCGAALPAQPSVPSAPPPSAPPPTNPPPRHAPPPSAPVRSASSGQVATASLPLRPPPPAAGSPAPPAFAARSTTRDEDDVSTMAITSLEIDDDFEEILPQSPPPRPAPPAQAKSRPSPAPPGPAPEPAAARAPRPPAPPRPSAQTGFERGATAAAELRCVQCTTVIPPGYAFCGVCGTPRGRSEAAISVPPPDEARSAGSLALIDDLGNESVRHNLLIGENRVGRGADCDVAFAHDGLLADLHCVINASEQPFRLKPVDLYNGTYLRISTPVELHHGDIVRVGQEVLRFERIEELVPESSPLTGRPLTVGCAMPRGVWGRVCQIGMARQVANSYLLSHRDVFLGRERGDILFPKDGFVSGSHAVISERGGRVYLKDLGSSNGTFLRVKREITLRNGDLLLLGRNLLRVHVGNP